MVKWAERFIIILLAIGCIALCVQCASLLKSENEKTKEVSEEDTWEPIDLLTVDVMGKTVNCYQWDETDLVHCLCEGDREFVINNEYVGMIFLDKEVEIEDDQGTIVDPYFADELTDLNGKKHTLNIYALVNDGSIYLNTKANCRASVQNANIVNNHYEQLDTEQANRMGEIVLNAVETEASPMPTIYHLSIRTGQFYFAEQAVKNGEPYLSVWNASYRLDVKSNSYGEMFIYDEDTKKTYQIQNEDLFDFKQILESVN